MTTTDEKVYVLEYEDRSNTVKIHRTVTTVCYYDIKSVVILLLRRLEGTKLTYVYDYVKSDGTICLKKDGTPAIVGVQFHPSNRDGSFYIIRECRIFHPPEEKGDIDLLLRRVNY